MINLSVPRDAEPVHKPNITVIGVGGAGGNAVNNMIADSLQGVDFMVANTDAQSLSLARTDRRIQLGVATTQGLGAGARPDVGRAAAEESYDYVAEQIQGSNMVFITAGMGGGTGTGAAPVIARTAREQGILTVGVVTKPFQFEGAHRMRLAESGIEELSQYVDTLIIIPNQNLFRVANEKTTFADAFKMADDVLNAGVRSITDLMIMPGLINLDFADVRTVMSDMGRAMMGTGEATGERRALDAAEAAIANPLLEDTCMRGAKGVLINITGGPDITLFEVDEAANRIRDEVEGEAHIIFGSCFDPEMEGKMRVSVVATGISGQANVMPRPQSETQTQAQGVVHNVRTSDAEPARKAPAAQVQAAQMAAPARAVAPQPVVHTAAPHQSVEDAEPMAAPAVASAAGNATRSAPLFGRPIVPTTSASQTAPAQQARPVQPAQQQQQPKASLFDAPNFRKPQDAFIPAQPVDRATPALHDAPRAPQAFASERSEAQASAERPAAPPQRADNPAARHGLLGRIASKLSRDLEREEGPARVEPHPSAPAPSVRHEDRPAPISQHQEEDELEIPAFLRRQAN